MSISSISTVPAGGVAAARGAPGEPRGRDNLLFTKRFPISPRRAGEREDEADLAAMMDMAGTSGGNNDSAAFAAWTPGAGETDEISIETLQDVLAEGGLASWLVSDGQAEELSLAELRAEVMGGEVLPSYGLAHHTPGLPDPAAPDYLDEVRRRLIGVGEAGPTPWARDALDSVLREERARMTERMVAQLTRGVRG